MFGIPRAKLRRAWTNGSVERLQGMILHDHWRIAFRRRCLLNRLQLQTSLDGFLQFYNFDRPHHSAAPTDAPQRGSSGARPVAEPVRRPEVSTPFRNRTP
jgi:hypothetical protein